MTANNNVPPVCLRGARLTSARTGLGERGNRVISVDEVNNLVDWTSVLVKAGIPETALRNKHGPCPACGGKDRFRFDHEMRGRGSFICSRCGSGDGFKLIMNVRGCSFPEALQLVIEAAGLAESTAEQIASPNMSRPAKQPAQQYDWSDKSDAIWRRAVPIRGTLAETYLHHRCGALPPQDSDLRFLAGNNKYPPSLCARVTDVTTAKPSSLHFTRLAADGRGKAGSNRDKLLLGGHRKKGGCIRLWPDDAVTRGLAIAEGIESALAVAHIHTPVWAAIDAGNLRAFPVLSGIESLTVFADHDEAGLKAAQTCAARWDAAGREVRILRARQAGEDAADLAEEAA